MPASCIVPEHSTARPHADICAESYTQLSQHQCSASTSSEYPARNSVTAAHQPGEVAADAEGKPAAAGSKRKAKGATDGAAPAKKPRPAAKAGARGAKKQAKGGKKAPAAKREKK